MTRDAVKTVIGLCVIAAIVVATFLYGNAQRRSQLKHDQVVKQQQDKATVSAAPTTGTASNTPKVTTNTAPVQTPQANTIQGGKTATPMPSSKGGTTAQAPSSSKAPVVANTTPQTGGTGAPLPQTGSPLTGVVGAAAIGTMVLAFVRSRRAVVAAARRL
jgi:cytoskeletal protein RodZ